MIFVEIYFGVVYDKVHEVVSIEHFLLLVAGQRHTVFRQSPLQLPDIDVSRHTAILNAERRRKSRRMTGCHAVSHAFARGSGNMGRGNTTAGCKQVVR